MNHVRIYGDPFGEDAMASRLRSFLRLMVGSGMRCSLALSAVVERPILAGESVIPLTDGVRDFRVGTRLPPAEIELLLKAADDAVSATAPVVVFAARERMTDVLQLAGLGWPRAAAVVACGETSHATELVGRVRAELRWAGIEKPAHALGELELRPWLAMPLPPEAGVVVHAGAGDQADGIDVVLAIWHAILAPAGRRLRLVLPDADALTIHRLEAELSAGSGDWQIVRSELRPAHLADASVVLQPWRRMRSSRVLVQSLAAARAVCVSRFAETAGIIDREGLCFTIGGRACSGRDGVALFEPDIDAVGASIEQALGVQKYQVGARARRHVIENLMRGCPAAAAPLLRPLGETRPCVVLEAPFFETSSSSELSIETARALARRGNVDLHLVPTVPFRPRLDELRRRAPELVPLLSRCPDRVDLWLSSGWPVRAARPPCGTFALRVDWEYGALPVGLTPHVSDEADLVIVHSDHVADTVAAAGRRRSALRIVPHGVDAAIAETAPPDQTIVDWKGELPAVLFCGGMVWRKGFDVFLRAVLAARAGGAEFAVVVKSIGGAQHYKGFDLRDLVERFRKTPGTPPLYLVERELSRSELASLYTACDVMLHPYRGEGFCLPVLEARAAGLPVLATAGGATEALMAGPGAVRIPSLRREIGLPGAHVGSPWVLEPDADAAARLLVEMLHDLPARQAAARGFAGAVRAAFSWAAAAASIEAMATAAAQARRSDAARPIREPAVTLPGPQRRPEPRSEPRPAARVELLPSP